MTPAESHRRYPSGNKPPLSAVRSGMPYRDFESGLLEQRRALVEEIERLDFELSRLEDSLERRKELSEMLRELDGRVRSLETKRRSVLARLRIASPCSARWEDMLGDDRVRFCPSCAKNVFDLSSLSEEEASALVARTEGRFCGRLRKRRDERVLTADCPVGARRKRRLGLAAAAFAAGGAAVAGLAASGEQPTKPLLLMVKGSESVASHFRRATEPDPIDHSPPEPSFEGMLGYTMVDDDVEAHIVSYTPRSTVP